MKLLRLPSLPTRSPSTSATIWSGAKRLRPLRGTLTCSASWMKISAPLRALRETRGTLHGKTSYGPQAARTWIRRTPAPIRRLRMTKWTYLAMQVTRRRTAANARSAPRRAAVLTVARRATLGVTVRLLRFNAGSIATRLRRHVARHRSLRQAHEGALRLRG